MKRSFGNTGNTLVQVLVAVGVMSIMAGAVASVFLDVQKSQAGLELRFAALDVRQSIVGALSNESAWQRILLTNPQLTCTSPNQAHCSASTVTTVPIKVMDARGNIIYDATSPTSGYTTKGLKCSTYSAAGNPACPLRVDVAWRGVCSMAPCSNTLDMISIQFTYNPGAGNKPLPFNKSNFDVVDLLRTKLGGLTSPQTICANQSKMYIGEGNSFNGYAADNQGCVAYAAFVGSKGDAGANGADAVCP